MMTKSKSKTWAKSKVLIALPVTVFLVFMLTATSSFCNSVQMKNAVWPAYNQTDTCNVPDQILQDKQKQETQIKFVPVDTTKLVFTTVEQMPSFPGEKDALVKFLAANIKYPEVAVKNAIQGKVFVSFIIRADGSVTDVKVLRGIGGGCDEESVRVVKLMPKWNPGKQKGKTVDVQFTLPIKFAFDGEKKIEPKK